MGNQITQSTQDQEKVDPQALAIELEVNFKAYYSSKTKELDRKKKDVASLKKRANIREDNAPVVTKNVIGALYSNLG